MPKKTERVDPLGVFNIHFVAKHQKIEGGPFGEKKISGKNVSQGQKTERWDHLVSPGMVCYRENRKNLFDSVR